MATGLGAFAAAAFALADTSAQGQLAPERTYDTSLPIEITADTLEVEQDKKRAVFRGDVDAVQGKLILRADKLIVHYRSAENDRSRISRVEAEGSVFLSSPTETAQGEQGVYDIDDERVEMIGSVVLSRGDNVIRGSRLTMDLASGRSRMEAGAPSAGEQGSRVRALFVPKQESD